GLSRIFSGKYSSYQSPYFLREKTMGRSVFAPRDQAPVCQSLPHKRQDKKNGVLSVGIKQCSVRDWISSWLFPWASHHGYSTTTLWASNPYPGAYGRCPPYRDNNVPT
ncbi:MAG TPA: hypothetical protein PLB32_15785, partial [Acidobacteriota bacterium]|nr:hypothetical protein [Acidobacteriota bacterium]